MISLPATPPALYSSAWHQLLPALMTLCHTEGWITLCPHLRSQCTTEQRSQDFVLISSPETSRSRWAQTSPAWRCWQDHGSVTFLMSRTAVSPLLPLVSRVFYCCFFFFLNHTITSLWPGGYKAFFLFLIFITVQAKHSGGHSLKFSVRKPVIGIPYMLFSALWHFSNLSLSFPWHCLIYPL